MDACLECLYNSAEEKGSRKSRLFWPYGGLRGIGYKRKSWRFEGAGFYDLLLTKWVLVCCGLFDVLGFGALGEGNGFLLRVLYSFSVSITFRS